MQRSKISTVIDKRKELKVPNIRITNMMIGIKEVSVNFELDDWVSDLTGKPEQRIYLFPESVYDLICDGNNITINEEIYDKLIDIISADCGLTTEG
jgi:hypothetical protein